ncbi:hypothetical protein [Aureimonas sp. AU20]|uniref:hypothetical protein n=1 Tax=Aureimonas sp. AU20 TaxID=1349819 RepID=UPI000A7E8566|nr:hypothetical protein [Aureimonas sp. AU20]
MFMFFSPVNIRIELLASSFGSLAKACGSGEALWEAFNMNVSSEKSHFGGSQLRNSCSSSRVVALHHKLRHHYQREYSSIDRGSVIKPSMRNFA